MAIRTIAVFCQALLLSSCSILQGSAEIPPPLTDYPQEIRRNQTLGLQKTGSVSVLVYGSPADAEEAIKAKVAAAKADYYTIIMIDETVVPAQWYSLAIMYRKP